MNRIGLLSGFLVFIFKLRIKSVFSQTTSDCNVNVSCFVYPDGCVDSNCTFIYKWLDNGDSTDFTLAGQIKTFTDRYLAIGFSLDAFMGNDTVVVCTTTGGIAQHYYTTIRTTPTFQNVSDISVGLSEVNLTQIDSWLICQFKRQKRNEALSTYYDLNNNYHVLASYGNFNSSTNKIRKHEFKMPSSRLYNFTEYSVHLSLIKNLLSTCDPTKMCFKYPDNCSDDVNCTFIYQWTDNGDSNNFILAAKIKTFTDRYLAIGFSLDAFMGNDTVVVCTTTGGIAQHYYTTIRTTPTFQNVSDISVGLSDVKMLQVDNWLICQFKRQKRNEALSTYYDLNNNYHVLASFGNFNSSTNKVRKHEFRTPSPRSYNFTVPSPVVVSPIINLLSTCDPTKMCFKYPDNCSDDVNCTFIYQWTDNGDSNTFTLAGKISNFTNRYLAIGFSLDAFMGNDTVVVCTTTGSIAQHYYTTIRTTPTFQNVSDISVGLSEVNLTQIDSWLICQFKRQKRNEALSTYYDLNNNYHVLASYGNFNSSTNKIRKHEFKIPSSRLYNFTELPFLTNPILNLLSTCDTTNMCFKYPTDCADETSCTFIYQWTGNGDSADFRLAGQINTFDKRYLAIGFSKSGFMGNSAIIACVTSGEAFHYYTPEHVQPNFLNSSDRSVGVSRVNTTQYNNWFICSFRRQAAKPSVTNYFDLAESYTLLASYGNFDDTIQRVRYHDFKVPSSVKYGFIVSTTTPQPFLTTETATTPIIKLSNTCGTVNNCFKYPLDCKSDSCTIIYQWTDNGDSNDFTLAAKVNTFTNRYLAIGFSKDRFMGQDDVIVCKTSGLAHHYYTALPATPPEFLNDTDRSIGLSDVNVTQFNNWLLCQVRRKKQSIDSLKNYFNLNNRHYVLAVYGDFDVATQLLDYHEFRTPSTVDYSFNETVATTRSTTQTPTISTSTLAANSITELQSTCGIKYGCAVSPSDCKGTLCTFIYKWADNGDKTDFVIAGKINSFTNRFLAIGFSKDNRMGDDSMVICKTTATNSTIETFYNPGYGPVLLDPTKPTLGLTNAKVRTDGNWMICEFTRVKQYSVTTARMRRDTANGFFDLNEQFYVLSAYGSLDPIDGSLQKHDYKIPSPKTVNFKSFEVIGGSVDYTKFKVHGSLMVVAWVLFASTGILFARYAKDLFLGKAFCGVQFWFTIHRSVMPMVPIISIAALVVILWQRNWTWINSVDKIAFIHSIFGIIAISLSVLQPFIAVMRCDKDHPKRFVFNWIHRTTGLSALTCAIVAIYLGLNISLLGLRENGWCILLGWTVWLIILIVVLELIVLKYDNNPSSVADKDSKDTKPAKSTKLKSIMLTLHLIITTGCSAALVTFIGITDPSQSTR